VISGFRREVAENSLGILLISKGQKLEIGKGVLNRKAYFKGASNKGLVYFSSA